MTRIDDRVYGAVGVDEAVLQELLETEPVQRLRRINQAGPQHYFMDKQEMTRYEHSVGVMLLLRIHDAPLAEQVAGLLHDVPHTAFSHLADFVFETDEHEYHERFMEEVVYDSDIPDVLARHGLSVDHILDEDNFPLLEQDAPRLCADRIDYFLRDVSAYGGADVSRFVAALDTHEHEFMFTDRDVAEEAALAYIEADEAYWANPSEVAVLHLFADAVRRALDIGVLSEDDLFADDDHVFETVQQADDTAIQETLTLLREAEFVLDEDNPDLQVETKCRWIDPPVLTGSEPVRVTEFSEAVERRIAEHQSFVEGGYPLRIDK